MFCVGCSTAPKEGSTFSQVVKDHSSNGFHWPYYLTLPKTLKKDHSIFILVIPTSSGPSKDDFAFHDNAIKKKLPGREKIAEQLGVALVSPVLHRPRKDWEVYTHALDLDSLTTKKEKLSRPDLQIIAMVEDAKRRLRKQGYSPKEKIFLWGFSAAGMFSNRFTLLHPKSVKAAAVGSPGGWPLAPISKYRSKQLPYPVGIANLKELVGKDFDASAVSKIPQFFYLGEKDDNDSVPFGDGYDNSHKEIVFELFGKTPVSRWEVSGQIYNEQLKCDFCQFKLYPGVGHTHTEEIINDVIKFFAKVQNQK